MTHKLLVTTASEEDVARVRATGAEVLAEYPEAVLVRATDDQERACAQAGMATAPLPSPPVERAGFRLDDALAVEAEDPLPQDPDRTAHFIVQLVGPVAQGWRATLAGHGVTVHGSLAGYQLLVGMPPGRREAVAAEPFVEAVTPYRPAMKISPRLRSDVTGRALTREALARVDVSAIAAQAQEQVEISLFEGEDVEPVAGRVRAAGGTVLTTGRDLVVAQVPPEAIVELANDEAVEAILPHAFPELSNDRASALIGVPAGTGSPAAGALTGAGQVIGVADSGIDTGDAATLHPDLRGRVTVRNSPLPAGLALFAEEPHNDGPADRHGHGTHVAGSIAGNGATAEKAGSATVPRGVAPEAHLHFTAIGQRVTWGPDAPTPGGEPLKPWGLWGNPADISKLLEPAYAAGARIHTNSWGASLAGQYNEKARGVDEFTHQHRDLLVLFSAGNEGADLDEDGQIDQDSITAPATAKNCLTVGASENDRPPGSVPEPRRPRLSDNPDGMAAFSSGGPTDDGRIKPEVVAPGTNVLSLRTSVYDGEYVARGPEPLWGDVRPDTDPLARAYCWSGGTSMATPLVAGVAALIRQHLVEQRGHHQDGMAPSGALLKAFLVNGAEPLPGQHAGEVPNPLPNHVTGFGRVNLIRSIASPVLFSDDPALALASQEVRRFRVRASGPDTPLRVTLTWTDPAAPLRDPRLQNILYLRLVPPGETPLDGDITPYPDATNNTQQVTVPVPVAGTYEVQVHGHDVITRSVAGDAPPGQEVQDFALVVSGAEELKLRPRLT